MHSVGNYIVKANVLLFVQFVLTEALVKALEVITNKNNGIGCFHSSCVFNFFFLFFYAHSLTFSVYKLIPRFHEKALLNVAAW